MSKTPSNLSTDLSPEIRRELQRTRPITHEMLSGLATANRQLETDPDIQADYLKAVFVEKMIQAMEERGESKAQVADKLGKSRQYVQKLFNEDRRVNFTIETLCAVAGALGQRLHLHVCKADEEPMILTAMKTRVLTDLSEWTPPAARQPDSVWLNAPEFKTTSTTSTKEATNVSADAA